MITKKISNDFINHLKETSDDNIEIIFDNLGIDVDSIIGIDDELRCPCPIHGGDNRTAFVYKKDKLKWYCYTKKCHEDGNSIINLVQKVLSRNSNKEVGFRDAVKWLCSVLNINFDNNVKYQSDDQNTKLLNGIIKENRILNRSFTNTNNREKFKPIPIEYIKQKFAPSVFFQNQGFTKELLNKYLIGDCYDHTKPMYKRAYAPVLDEDGKHVIGVTGRVMLDKCNICGNYHNGNKGCPEDNPSIRAYPKWLHYGFGSEKVLYNIWFAKEYIRKTKTVVITEGPKDVWWLEQHGIHNSVCIFGLYIYDYHIRTLMNCGVINIIVALDNDEKGIEAAERLQEKIGDYFNLINIKGLMSYGEDIGDIPSDRMNNVIVPFIKKYGE